MITPPPFRRITPFPRPPGTSKTTLRCGVPWTELTGHISPDMLRAAVASYADLGGGYAWAFDCDMATNYSRDAIECASLQIQCASFSGGLRLMVASVPHHVVRMAASSLLLGLVESCGVRLVVVDAAAGIHTEIGKQRAAMLARGDSHR
jgi:hypothetical protein